MTTIKPKAADGIVRRVGTEESPAPESIPATSQAPHSTEGGPAALGALAARAVQQVVVARPDVLVRRLLTASYVGMWAWEKYARKVTGAQAVSAQKMMYELAKTAINETQIGGLTVQAMNHSGQMVFKLSKAGQAVKTPAVPVGIAATPLGKVIPYLNALAVPLAALQLSQVEGDTGASAVEKNLARASLALTTVAAAASFTSNPLGWAVSAGAGALASGADLALMATRNQASLTRAYRLTKAQGEKLLKSLSTAPTPVHP